jgi:tripartite-type tricarboxylate transporter receptor subunit TctC
MRRRNVLLLGAALAGVVLAGPAMAQQPVTKIIVGFAPGGPVDSVARILGDQLGRELGHTVIIENKSGANAAIAAAEVKKSPPDGRTLWITSVGGAAINQALYANLAYSMETDFQPISVVVNNDELLVVSKQHPAKTAAEFIASAKAANGTTAMASSGMGSIPHLAIEQLSDATGAQINHVAYRGAAPAINDVANGTVAAFFGDVAGLIGNIGEKGLLKPIGIAAPKRHPLLPDVATLDEQGIKGIDTNNWYALYGPAKMPPETVAALNKAVRAALAHGETAAKLLKLGAEPAPSSPEELAALQKRDAEKWSKLIKAKNIKAE